VRALARAAQDDEVVRVGVLDGEASASGHVDALPCELDLEVLARLDALREPGVTAPLGWALTSGLQAVVYPGVRAALGTLRARGAGSPNSRAPACGPSRARYGARARSRLDEPRRPLPLA